MKSYLIPKIGPKRVVLIRDFTLIYTYAQVVLSKIIIDKLIARGERRYFFFKKKALPRQLLSHAD